MPAVTVNGKTREYPEGTAFLAAAQDFQPDYEDEILLVRANGKLKELHKTIVQDCEAEFITASDRVGRKTYERSAVFVMLKAFYDVVPREKIEKIQIEFSMGNGVYGELIGGVSVDQALISQVKARMEEIVEAKLPLMKRSVNTDEAVELFGKYGMRDKELLFKYRRASRVNIYSIGNFEDYFYGYMVQNTGYVKYYDLIPYEGGFLLLLPGSGDTRKIAPHNPQPKLFHVLKESNHWSELLEVPNVGALNEMISGGRMNELILMQEALQEKNIGKIAEQAAGQAEKKFILIAGPSSSGKTTFCHRLAVQLKALGLTPHPISMDNYFKNRSEYPKDENGEQDLEALECLDIELFNRDMNALLRGERIEMPRFNFITGCREYRGDSMQLGRDDVMVIEGIHCLNPKMSANLPEENKFRIYISALTQLNVDEHNRIPTTDGRILRRMVRDARTRGTSAEETLKRWPSVRRGEDRNIFPYQEMADVTFNSALVYELAVLKLYAEPLLFHIPRDSEDYDEAKRLLKVLDYFLGVGSENIPKNSIIREFIGGSCLRV